MQRSSLKRQQAKGHGERGHIAVSTHGTRACAAASAPTAFSSSERVPHARDFEEASIPLEHGWPERAPSYVPHVVLKEC